ncbi:carbohydrate ABC transporter permease [Ruania albidiflava]|uniref:carbohydrate ABC transporter permease n=1 Tax=Ruania albidiflava TaxID=366586 RepID=UPI0023F20F56|nr:sugar ABC transporter permease [Ruania albidiflava]
MDTTETARTLPANTRKRSKRTVYRSLWGTAMALPVLVPFITFGIVPLIWLVAISVTDYDGFLRMEFIGLDNYTELLGDTRWWRSVANTLMIAVCAVAIQLPIGFGLAVLLNAASKKIATTFRTIFFLPYIIPAMISGVLFGFLVGPTRLGIVNDLLMNLGLVDSPITFLGTRFGALAVIVIATAWMEFGFTLLLFHAGLQSVPEELYEAAQLDGASRWRSLVSITLPMLRPIINVILLLAMVSVMKSFDVVKSLTNGGPAGASDVMFTHIYDLFFSQQIYARIGYASAVSVVASVIIAVSVGVVFIMIGRGRKKGA